MGWAGARGWGVKHGVWRQRGCSALGTRRAGSSGVDRPWPPSSITYELDGLGQVTAHGSFLSFRRGNATYLAGLAVRGKALARLVVRESQAR